MTRTGETVGQLITSFCALIIALSVLLPIGPGAAHKQAKKLYDKILREKGYNHLIRPVSTERDVVIVDIALKISQLIDVVIYIIKSIVVGERH